MGVGVCQRPAVKIYADRSAPLVRRRSSVATVVYEDGTGVVLVAAHASARAYLRLRDKRSIGSRCFHVGPLAPGKVLETTPNHVKGVVDCGDDVPMVRPSSESLVRGL
jgi:hypothetical protein